MKISTLNVKYFLVMGLRKKERKKKLLGFFAIFQNFYFLSLEPV